MTNLIGQSLGRYHILERLGEGGMATVYKAYDTRLERDVAVKVLRTEQFAPAALERILKRFEREAKALARLNHPNIVGVIDYGEYKGTPYLVMPYLPGGTLKQRLGKPIPWQEAMRVLIPIARALEYAHEHHIVHRDVKPSNILLTENSQPMLTDFGIAKILEIEETATLTGTGIGIGTPEYMAPEQWTGGTTARSDIYSLGIVLYEMVTGRKPYLADTPAAILLKQATEPLPRPTLFAPDLPERVEKMLIKALAKNQQDRYQSMAEFTADMEKLVKGLQSERGLADLSEICLPVSNTFATVEQEDSCATRLEETTYDPRSMSKVKSPTSTMSSTPVHEIQRKQALPVWVYLMSTGISGVVIVLLCIVAFGGGFIGRSFGPAQVVSSSTIAIAAPTEASILPVEALQSQIPPESQILPTDVPSLAPTFTLVPTFTPKPLRNPTGKIVYTCQVSGNSELNDICIMNADGSGFRQLTNGANNGWPSISPDGSAILFSSNASGSWQIYKMSLNGQSIQQLTFGPDEAFAPDMSPNGQIVYKNGTPQTDSIWVMNADGSGAHQVYQTGWDPVWSPDGLQILFAWGELNSAQLYVINANGSGLKQLTNMANIRGRSDWSVNNLIAFYAGLPWQRNLFIIRPDGSDLFQLTNGGNSQGPSFSPDGEWIAFTGYFDNMNDANGCEIYIIRVDGSDLRRLTNNSYCDWQPRWGP